MVTNCRTLYYFSVSYSLWIISNDNINSFNHANVTKRHANVTTPRQRNQKPKPRTIKISCENNCRTFMSALHSAQITTFTTAYFLSAFITFFTIRGVCSETFTTLLFYTLCLQQLFKLLQQQYFFFTTPVYIVSSDNRLGTRKSKKADK